MILTARNVPLYLVEQGMFSLDSIVDGQLTVVDVTRRNRNFKVLQRNQPGLFVKQAAPWDTQALETVRCEARCHWLAQHAAEFQPLAPLLPPFQRFDATRAVLVVGLIPQAETLNQYHQRLHTFPPEIAILLAQALAAYHRHFSGWLATSRYRSIFAQRLPWILSAADPGAVHAAYASAGSRELLSVAQSYGVDRTLRQVREQWQTETLIHGDIKWENCLITGPDATQPERSPYTAPLRLIDWEIADIGDPAWDAGSIFQSYLTFWLLTIPAEEGVPPTDLLARAPQALTIMHPAMQAFWRTYIAALGAPDSAALLARTVQYTAARLLQTAYESLFMSSRVTPHALLMLHVAATMLQSHTNAVATIFGE